MVLTPAGLTRVRTLGHGTESEVVLCRDDDSGDLVTLKILRPVAGEEARRGLRQEEAVLRSLAYAGLPTLRSSRLDEDPAYLVFDYIHGTSLAELRSPLGGAAFDRVALDLLGALYVLHERGWVHYDVTSRNVMVEDPETGGGVRLIDAGLAGPSGRTLRGTPGTMAPELLRGEPGGADSDVYSAAVVLAGTALGEDLLGGRTPREMLDEALVLPETLRARLEGCLGEGRAGVLLEALAPDRRERIGDAFELLSRLRELGIGGARERIEEATAAVVASAFDAARPERALRDLGWESGSASLLGGLLERETTCGRFEVPRFLAWLVGSGRVHRRRRGWILDGFEDRWLVHGLDREAVLAEVSDASPEARAALYALAATYEIDEAAARSKVGRALRADLEKLDTDLLVDEDAATSLRIRTPAVAAALLEAIDDSDRRVAHRRVAELVGAEDETAAYHRLRAGESIDLSVASHLEAAAWAGRLDIARPLAEAVRAALEEGDGVPGAVVLAAAWAEAEARRWGRMLWLAERAEDGPERRYLAGLSAVRIHGSLDWPLGEIDPDAGTDSALAHASLRALDTSLSDLPADGLLDDLGRMLGVAPGAAATRAEWIAGLGRAAADASRLARHALLIALGVGGNAFYAQGDLEAAEQAMLGARNLARTWGRRLQALLLEGNRANCLLRRRETRTAVEILERAGREREALGDHDGAILVWGNLGVARYDEGDVDGALATWQRQTELIWRSGDIHRLGSNEARIACAQQEAGLWREAGERFESAVRLTEAFCDRSLEILARCNLTMHVLDTGRIARAREELSNLEGRLSGGSVSASRMALVAYIRARIDLVAGEPRWDAETTADRLRRVADGEDGVLPDLAGDDVAEVLLRNALLAGVPEDSTDAVRRIEERDVDDPSIRLLCRRVLSSGEIDDAEIRATIGSLRDRVLDSATLNAWSLLADGVIVRESAGRRTKGRLSSELRDRLVRIGLPGLRWRGHLLGALSALAGGEYATALAEFRSAASEVAECHGMASTLPPRPELNALVRGIRALGLRTGTAEPAGTSDRTPAALHALLARVAVGLLARDEGRGGSWGARVERILSIARMLNETKDVSALLDRIVASMLDLCDAEYGFAVLLDEDGNADIHAARTACSDASDTLRATLSRTMVDRVLAEKRTVLVRNALDEEWLIDRDSVRALSLRSVIGTPLTHHGNLLGALYVDNRTTSDSFDEDDRRLLEIFASQASVALVNGRLFADLESSYGALADAQEKMVRSETLRNMGVLAGGIAHDFNNLLVAMMGNADLALQGLDEEHESRRHVDEIKSAAFMAADLCNELLAYSGGSRAVTGPLDLSHVVHGVVKVLRVSVPKKVRLAFDLDASLPAVEADDTHIRQIVLNLVTNAAEAFDDEEGSIHVRTDLRTVTRAMLDRSPLVEDLRPGEYVALEVEDTGCGMDEWNRQRVFEPFFTTKFAGRGMGLAAVLGIVRRHRGGILVESEPGRGTRVLVFLPPSSREAPKPERERGQDGWKGRGTVLLVDDEEAVRAVAGEMLKMFGLDVLEAEDGRHAVEVFSAHRERVNLVLLDMNMPRMNGRETFEALRELRPDLAVLISSGYSEGETLQAFEGDMPAGFVAKPYDLRTLREKVRGVLGG